VAAGYCNKFYDQQKSIERGWIQGAPAPLGLALGELPYVNTREFTRFRPFYLKTTGIR
jgi:hypothetical protein